VEALQLSYQKSVATPANWPNNHAVVTLKDGTKTDAYKGSVFLLPTVSDDEAAQHYPNHLTCTVPSNIPYLRLVKASEVGGRGLPKDESTTSVPEQAATPTKQKKTKKDKKKDSKTKKVSLFVTWFRRKEVLAA
jgi:C-terminal domain of 1-Cys peroxiredoxin